jgi:hypothetical protein
MIGRQERHALEPVVVHDVFVQDDDRRRGEDAPKDLCECDAIHGQTHPKR